MGQKTHPRGFRLITTESHLSKWYTNKLSYPSVLEEDYIIRSFISKNLGEIISLSKIEIRRDLENYEETGSIKIKVFSLFPRAKEMAKKLMTYFLAQGKTLPNFSGKTKNSLKELTLLFIRQKIRKIIRALQQKLGKNCEIELEFVKNQFEDAKLIAKYIADQLERRIPFRRAVKKTIKKVKLTSIKGIKIQVAGRLNGVEIARSEWKRDGKIPLHTLRAKIDYTRYAAQTIYGLIGIKVWLLKS
jgi:small subunit ribosomal protein S3